MELKPCPFCGSNKVKIHMPYFTSDCYMVQCYGCNCNTAVFDNADKAAEAWNRRADNG
jgi:Lar family restriction alleviation protein